MTDSKEKAEKEDLRVDVPEEKEAKEQRPVPKPHKGKRKKIGCLSLNEVEAGLESAKKTMGGHFSRYAKALLARKEFLEQRSGAGLRRAA